MCRQVEVGSTVWPMQKCYYFKAFQEEGWIYFLPGRIPKICGEELRESSGGHGKRNSEGEHHLRDTDLIFSPFGGGSPGVVYIRYTTSLIETCDICPDKGYYV